MRKSEETRPAGLPRRAAAAALGLGLSLCAPLAAWAHGGGASGAARGIGDWVETTVPEYFVEIQLLDIRLWQWVALAVLIGLASILGHLAARVLFRLLAAAAKRSRTRWDDVLLAGTIAPLRLAGSVALFYVGAVMLHLSAGGQSAVEVVCKILIVCAAVWLAMRVVDVFADFTDQVLDGKGDLGTKSLVPMGRRITKVFLLTLAALSLLQNLGFNVASLLAGLGIGGLAVALAAQKSLENVFGGLVVIADRPVNIGDFCRVGEHLGTVEDIGLRSARLRTLDRTLVSIPNAEFSTARIENYGKRDSIRLITVLQVGYDTSPDQMRFLLVELRRMLYAHPRTLPDPCRVRFVNFGAHSLDLEVLVYIDTADFNDFTAVREDIYLRIMEIVSASGAYFAYPSQTLYLGRDAGRDLANTETAEAEVKAWREAGRMPMPEFPPELIAEIDDSLDYPPEGSTARAEAAAGG